MDSYVEAAFILNGMINYAAVQIGCALTSVILSKKEKLCYVLIITSCGSFMFMQGSLMIMFLLETAFFLKLFYKTSQMYLVSIGFRFLMILSLIKWMDGSVHNLLFFPAVHVNLLPVFLLYGLFLLALSRKWQVYFSMHHYMHEVYLDDMKVMGYLDSGNSAMAQGLPIIVASKDVYEMLKEEESSCVEVHTLTNKGSFAGKKAMLRYKSGKSIQVIVIMSEEKLLLGADCLLNMNGVRI